eukprot:4088531-Pyramimonas_sp.AAC.1
MVWMLGAMVWMLGALQWVEAHLLRLLVVGAAEDGEAHGDSAHDRHRAQQRHGDGVVGESV